MEESLMDAGAARERMRFSLDVTVLYVGIHLACFAAVWTGVSWKALGVCAASFFLRMFGLGAGYHRYFAHRAFKTSRAMQFALALLGALSVQKGVLWWAWTHRDHHRHADTPEDIHSPRYHGFVYAHSGWFMNKNHQQTDLAKVSDLAKFPELVFLEKWYFVPIVAYAAALTWLWGGQGFVWGFCVSTVLLYHTTHWIQSMSHSVGGYRRFETSDNTRNHWLLGLLSLGEWHNNHHHSPSSAQQGAVWWEIDINFYILKALSWVGLVWDLRPAPGQAAQP